MPEQIAQVLGGECKTEHTFTHIEIDVDQHPMLHACLQHAAAVSARLTHPGVVNLTLPGPCSCTWQLMTAVVSAAVTCRAPAAASQVEAMKHGFAIRTALGDPGTPQQPFPHAAAVNAAVQDLLDDAFVEKLRAATKDNGVLPDTEYGGRWAWLPSGCLQLQALMVCSHKGGQRATWFAAWRQVGRNVNGSLQLQASMACWQK